MREQVNSNPYPAFFMPSSIVNRGLVLDASDGELVRAGEPGALFWLPLGKEFQASA